MLGRAAQLASRHGVISADGEPIVGVEHLFLAILQEEDSVPVQAIVDHVDILEMIDLVLNVMLSEPYMASLREERDRRTHE